MGSPSYDRMWNSAYIKLCAIELCLQMGMQTTSPVTANAALALGATVTLAGILAGVGTSVSLALRIVCGHIMSRLPMKAMLVESAAILSVSGFLFGALNSIEVLGVARVIYGTGIVVKTVLGVSMCVYVVPQEKIGQAVAWLGMANVLCVALGPNIAQFVGAQFGYNCSFLLSGLLCALGTAIALTFPHIPLAKDARSDKAQVQSEAPNEEGLKGECPQIFPPSSGSRVRSFAGSFVYFDAIPIAIMGVIEGSMFAIVATLTLTAAELRSLPEMSLFFIVYVVVAFCTRPFIGKLYDRLGFGKVCLPMCALMTLSMVTFAFTESMPMIVVDGVLFALGQGSLWPCLQAESVHGVPQEKTSLAANTLLLGVDMGMTLGPMIGGAVLDAAGPTWMYLFATGIGVCLCLWTVCYIRLARKRKSRG